MKKEFREFYYKETIDFEHLDESVLIVFDTNVLLHIFRFSIDSRNKLISSLDKVKSNIWIPYHVGLEYNLHKVTLLNEMREAENGIKKNIDKEKGNFKDSIFKELNNFGINSSDETEVRKKIKASFEKKLNDMVEEWKSNELIKEFKLIGNVDDESDRLADVFEGKVGSQYSQKEIDIIEKEGATRYEVNFPPGYKDGKKDIRKKYGNIVYSQKYSDLIIWKQIIDKAKDEKINKVVFVSDDKKEDWQYFYGNKKINKGPRAELKKELLDESNADFYSLDTNSFLRQVINEESDIVDLSSTVNNYDNYKSIANIGVNIISNQIDNIFSKASHYNNNEATELNESDKTLIKKVMKLEKAFGRLNYKMSNMYDNKNNLNGFNEGNLNEFFTIQKEIIDSESQLEEYRDNLFTNFFKLDKLDKLIIERDISNLSIYYKELEERYEYLLLKL